MAESVAHEGPGKGTWVVLLATFAAASGAYARYPLLSASTGLAFLVFFALGIVLLGLPLVLAEAALGQFRRRNVVAAFGPGRWAWGGGALALAATLSAVLLAVVGGWFAQYALQSFNGDYFDDPDRSFRLLAVGWDAMLATLAVLGAAFAAMVVARTGRHGAWVGIGTVALLALAALAAWAFFQPGAGPGRDAALAIDLAAIDAPLVVQALLQSLLPVAVGLGLVTTISLRTPDQALPREAATLATLAIALPLAGGLFLLALSSAHGDVLAQDRSPGGPLFSAAPHLFADIGGTAGGILSGTFFGALAAASILAVAALLEVPALWLQETWTGWTPGRARLACTLAAYVAAVPFCFSNDAVHSLHLALAGVVVPLGGLLVALHVGWVRPQVLDGLRVGDVGHRLDATLRPCLRFVTPPALLFLLVIGTMAFLADAGWASRGDGGLWSLVP